MPFGHTWTLWQRLPPRYQLTARPFEDNQESAVTNNFSESSPSPRLFPSPRAQSASARDHIYTYDTQSEQENADKENKPVTFRQRNAQTASFPRRKSDYVSHFQTQRRVSSARRRLAETPPQPAIYGPMPSSSYVSYHTRSQTAPAFPVTCPEFHEEQLRRRNIERYIQNNNSVLQTREKTKNKLPDASKQEIFRFDDSKSVKSVDLLSESEAIPKKYLVQETKDAVMYVDKGKISYFRKSRHDLTNLLKTQTLRSDRSNCFIAELRKDYLKHPKYHNKLPSDRIYKQSLTDPRVIASDRVNYNERLERILKYYSDKDSNPDGTSRSRPSSGRGSQIKGLSLASVPSRPPSPNPPTPGRPDSANDFIRMHKRSKLHSKQFYLRTPSQKHAYSTKELESCRCYMCRVELQLALVTGIPTDIALAATNLKTTKFSLPVTENLELVRSKSEGNEKMSQTDVILQGTETRDTTSRVTFHQPEVTSVGKSEKSKEHTLTISCTLPGVTDTARTTSDMATPVN